MISGEAVVFVFVLEAVALVCLILGTSYLLRVKGSHNVGQTVYECGEEDFGDARVQFNFRYYVFALIYVIFAVETVFIVPWAVALKHSQSLALFAEMVLFIGILAIGLGYAWKKGALEWF